MNGILLVNKEKNLTSHDVVYKIKKIYNEKVGHTGTLDPNATGVLPLLIGDATKISKYLIEHDKTYLAEIKLGIKTSTKDQEGEIIETKDVPELSLESIENVLKTFLGKQIQTPPIYSAIKVKGKKLYEYARENIEVEIPKREIEVYSIELISYIENILTIKLHVSKGTYIRSLAESISEKLGTVGYLKELKRTTVGQFDIKNSVNICDIENNKNNKEYLNSILIKIEDLFSNYQSIKLDDSNINKLLNGVLIKTSLEDGIYKLYYNEAFIGLGKVLNGSLKRDYIKIK